MDVTTVDGDSPAPPRVLAMLRAVAAGRAEVSCSCEPDLYIEGLVCCDQYTAHQLARRGLIRPAGAGEVGQLVRAELTSAGHAVLAAAVPAGRGPAGNGAARPPDQRSATSSRPR